MQFLKRIFGKKTYEPGQRVRICVECGMPVGEHKDWCAIYRHQQGKAGSSGESPRPAVE